MGSVVGESAQAEQLVADVEKQFAHVRADHPEFEGVSAVVATPYEGISVYGPEDPRGRLLAKLGFVVPPWAGEVSGNQFGGNLSLERVDLLDVDAIVWLDADDSEGPLAGPVYSSLDVHQQEREVFLDSFNDPMGAATSFVSVLSLPFLLDGLTPMLEAAVDGDPGTDVDQGDG